MSMKQLKFIAKQSVSISLICIMFLTLASSANAAGLEYYGIEDIINPDLSVTSEITMKFDSPLSHLDYKVDFEIYNLTFSKDFEYANCNVVHEVEKNIIRCDFRGITKEENTLTLRFNMRNNIKRVDGNYQFSVNYGISIPIEGLFVLIRLPDKGILAKEGNESYFPGDGNILSDGKRIMVFWEKTNMTSGDNLQFSVLYSIPVEVSNQLIIGVASLVIIIMIIIALYVKKTIRTKHEIVTSVLNENEKKIIDILNQKEGKVYQKTLVRESEFSKAKVSRLVKDLKDRGVVDIEPVSGRENRIILRLKEEEK